MKRLRMIAIILAAVMALSSLTGCSLFKPTAVSITKKVMKNLETVKSVKGNIRAHYEGPASVEGIEFNLALKADLKTETVRDSGVSHVEGSVGTELPIFGEIFRAADDMSGAGASIPEDLDFTGADADIVLYVYKDEMLPASVTVDCTALGNLLIKEKLSENGVSVSANKFVITLDDLEYNTIDELKIPEKVISSAFDAPDSGLFEDVTGL